MGDVFLCLMVLVAAAFSLAAFCALVEVGSEWVRCKVREMIDG